MLKSFFEKLIKHRTVITGIFTLSLGALVFPVASDLKSISETRENYLFDSGVAEATQGTAGRQFDPDEYLNPSFMKKYNLDAKNYEDAKGYFSPNGNHWKKWNLQTRTAAILMWHKSEPPSTWELYRSIRQVSEFYERGDLNAPAVAAVKIALQRPAN